MRAGNRKGVSTTMEIIIAIVVILVAALVILSIFGQQLQPIVGGIDVNTRIAQCQTACNAACISTGTADITKLGAVCKDIPGFTSCPPCGT